MSIAENKAILRRYFEEFFDQANLYTPHQPLNHTRITLCLPGCTQVQQSSP